MRHPSKIFFLHLRSCRRPDIELSKFYRHSLSRSRYNRLTVPFRPLETINFKEIYRSFLDIYARRVVPGFPVDGHIYRSKLDFVRVVRHHPQSILI